MRLPNFIRHFLEFMRYTFRIIKLFFSGRFRNSGLLKLLNQYLYDFMRFAQWSAAVQKQKTRPQIEALITARVHSMEKRLLMRTFSVTKAKFMLDSLINGMNQYMKQGYDTSGTAFQSAVHSIRMIQQTPHCKALNTAKLKKFADKLPPSSDQPSLMGTIECQADRIRSAAKGPFDLFSQCRHSIRDFSDEIPDYSVIEDAVRLAQKSPSVCNRQCSLVNIYTDPNDIRQILQLQSGNDGFGHKIKVLILVLADLNVFLNPGERNQAFIDGGLFAMSLLNALHFKGLGACPLNWSVESDSDIKLRQLTQIPESQTVIFMIGTGHLPEHFTVAKSTRKDISEAAKKSALPSRNPGINPRS